MLDAIFAFNFFIMQLRLFYELLALCAQKASRLKRNHLLENRLYVRTRTNTANRRGVA